MNCSKRAAATFCAGALLTLAIRTALASGDDFTAMPLSKLMQLDVTLVNAQKRVEDANTVPISMTVLKAPGLNRASLDSTTELQAVVPGLTTSSTEGLMAPYIRGVGTDNTNSIEPSVSMYVDGVYQISRAQTFVDFADVEQIEVLRGPQGTLYGRNTTGGAINITTRGPSDTLHGAANVSVGNYNLRDSSVFIAGPVNERVRASFAGHVREKGAYYENVLGLHEPKSEDFYSLHGRLQVDVTDSLDAEFLVKYLDRYDSWNAATELNGHTLPSILGLPVSMEPITTSADSTGTGNTLKSTVTALKLNWRGELLNVSSTSSYTDLHWVTKSDLDNSPMQIVDLLIDAPTHGFTQELQISPADPGERVDWLAGAFYLHSSTAYDPFRILAPLETNPLYIVNNSRSKTNGYAAFGEATFHLTDAFSLTSGLRYSVEDKRLENVSYALLGLPVQSNPDRSESWDNTGYRLVAKYTTGQSMFYAKTETGFKSGMVLAVNYPKTDPERLTTYEIGVKHAFESVPVHIAAAVFHSRDTNMQLEMTGQLDSMIPVGDPPDAKTKGVDAVVDVKVSTHWDLSAGLTWLDATYSRFTANTVLLPDAGPLGGHYSASGLNLSGNHLSRSPEWSGNVGVAFDYPVKIGSVFGGANYYYSDRVYYEASNTYSQDPFGLVNARLGFRTANGWELSAWGKNLTDEAYLDSVLVTKTNALGHYSEPRTFGLNATYSF